MKRKLKCNITGFGQFGDIKENPTTVLVNRLKHENKQFEKLEINQHKILDVNISACDQYFLDNQFDDIDFILHLGVAAGYDKFALEQYAYNMADFPCPDTEGNQFQEQQITQNMKLDDSLETQLNLNDVLENLIKLNHKVGISNDPGRYICNFLYFTSLMSMNNQKTISLFCHVPSFTEINENEQYKFLIDLIQVIGNSLYEKIEKKQNYDSKIKQIPFVPPLQSNVIQNQSLLIRNNRTNQIQKQLNLIQKPIISQLNQFQRVIRPQIQSVQLNNPIKNIYINNTRQISLQKYPPQNIVQQNSQFMRQIQLQIRPQSIKMNNIVINRQPIMKQQIFHRPIYSSTCVFSNTRPIFSAR